MSVKWISIKLHSTQLLFISYNDFANFKRPPPQFLKTVVNTVKINTQTKLQSKQSHNLSSQIKIIQNGKYWKKFDGFLTREVLKFSPLCIELIWYIWLVQKNAFQKIQMCRKIIYHFSLVWRNMWILRIVYWP